MSLPKLVTRLLYRRRKYEVHPDNLIIPDTAATAAPEPEEVPGEVEVKEEPVAASNTNDKLPSVSEKAEQTAVESSSTQPVKVPRSPYNLRSCLLDTSDSADE